MQALIEGFSKKSDAQLSGRTDTMKRVVLDDVAMPSSLEAAAQADPSQELVRLQPGDYVAVEVQSCTSGTLFAKPLCKTTLQAFAQSLSHTDPQTQQTYAPVSTPQRELTMSC